MLAVLLAIILALALYFSEALLDNFRTHKRVTSFAAGISVAYLFVQLLPEFTARAVTVGRPMFFTVLFGFLVYFLVEKYLYRRHAKREALRRCHTIFTIVYHFSIGVTLVDVIADGILPAFAFLIPVSIHLAVSSAVEHHIHEGLAETMRENRWLKLAYALVPLIGTLSAGLFNWTATTIFMGIFAGSMFFIVIREAIPRRSEGYPRYFAAGSVLFSLLLLLFWFVL